MIDTAKLLVALTKSSGLSPEQWEGRCYQMACCLIDHKLVQGVAVYGHWRGPVAEGSRFDRGLPFVQHGWVKHGPESRFRSIIDPTRWVFEGKKPYIYFGENDWYDEGGNVFHQAQAGSAPSFDPTDRVLLKRLPLRAWKRIQEMLTLGGTNVPNPVRVVSVAQLFWLANQPPSVFAEHAPAVYLALHRIGRAALIPIDNQRMVERGDWMP